VLAKRDGYREAFAGFDWTKVARYDARRVERLLGNAGIVRHRGKIESTIANARALVALHRDGGTLGGLAWGVVGGRPRSPRPRLPGDIPARTADSDALAKALRSRGFRFLGSTTCYAFMQACGLTNDHLPGCHRHAPVEALGRAFVAPGPPPTTATLKMPAAAPSASGSRAARARRG
jgi:DNA-3-methyladenine glycosylase I